MASHLHSNFLWLPIFTHTFCGFWFSRTLSVAFDFLPHSVNRSFSYLNFCGFWSAFKLSVTSDFYAHFLWLLICLHTFCGFWFAFSLSVASTCSSLVWISQTPLVKLSITRLTQSGLTSFGCESCRRRCQWTFSVMAAGCCCWPNNRWYIYIPYIYIKSFRSVTNHQNGGSLWRKLLQLQVQQITTS